MNDCIFAKPPVPEKMSPNRIVIIEVDPKYDADYIANVFWRQDIGQVSSITLLPQINGEKITNIAYVYFNLFYETDVARGFIDAMKSEWYMFYHNHDDIVNNIWVIEKNTHHSGQLSVGPYTHEFAPDYFEEFNTGDPSFNSKTVDLNGLDYIVGLDKNYTIDEALQRLWYLDEQGKPNGKYYDFIDEIYHLEIQIALHYISRGQAKQIMYDILTSLDVKHDEHIIDVRREVGMSSHEYDQMQKFIDYCKPRLDFMYQNQNPTNIQREYATGTLELIDLSILSNAHENLPSPPSPLSPSDRQTAMTDKEIQDMYKQNLFRL